MGMLFYNAVFKNMRIAGFKKPIQNKMNMNQKVDFHK